LCGHADGPGVATGESKEIVGEKLARRRSTAVNGRDRGAEADRVNFVGWVERSDTPSSYAAIDGYRFALPILWLMPLEGRGRRQTPVHGFEMIELLDGAIEFFADRNPRQIILHLFDAGRKVSNIELLNR
jgi:hypothetical protein